MKIAICIPGQLRTFSKYYDTLIKNFVIPLENKNKNKVDIFMDCFWVENERELDGNKFNAKFEVDIPGWEKIVNESKYIKYKNFYKFSDSTFYNLIEKINKINDKKYNIDEIKKYTKYCRKLNSSTRFYNLLVNGLSMHYNNKNLIDKIPSNYDIIIRTRADIRYIEKIKLDFNFDKIINSNSIHLMNKHNGQKNTALYDQIIIGSNNNMKKLYKNFFKECLVWLDIFKLKGIYRAETMLNYLIDINNFKVIPICYEFDKDFIRYRNSNNSLK